MLLFSFTPGGAEYLHGEAWDWQQGGRLAAGLGPALHPALVRLQTRTAEVRTTPPLQNHSSSDILTPQQCEHARNGMFGVIQGTLARSRGLTPTNQNRAAPLWAGPETRAAGLHTNMFGPGAELRGPAKACKKSGGLAKSSSSSASKSARVFNRSGGRRGELLLS